MSENPTTLMRELSAVSSGEPPAASLFGATYLRDPPAWSGWPTILDWHLMPQAEKDEFLKNMPPNARAYQIQCERANRRFMQQRWLRRTLRRLLP